MQKMIKAKRRHEHFSWSGYKYAPESMRFFLNGKLIDLPEDVHHEIAYLAVCGKSKEVSDELKRWLRKKEKEPRIAGKSICFFGKDSDEYYYTRDLMYKPYNIEDALYCYKRWKNYILSKNGMVNVGYEITEGQVVPGGSIKTGSHTVERKVDFSKRKSVAFINPDIYGNY